MSPEAHELYLFTISDSALYRQQGEPIVKNLARKKIKGVFKEPLAVKLYKYLADNAAKKYTFEFGDKGNAGYWASVKGYGIFTVPQRVEAAKALLDYYREQIDATARVLRAKK